MRRWIVRIVAVRQLVVPQYPDGLVVSDPQTIPVAVQLGPRHWAPLRLTIPVFIATPILPCRHVLSLWSDKSRLVFRPPPQMPRCPLLFSTTL
jgi:hypothetical protein